MSRPNNLLLVLAALAAFAANAAGGAGVGVEQTLGSANYRGTKANASVDLNDSVYIEPSFSIYRSDTSKGSYKNLGLRLGCAAGPLALGAQVAVQPKVNGYRQTSFGADAAFSLTPRKAERGRKMAGPSSGKSETFGSGLAGVDVGGAFRHITHSDDFSAAGPRAQAIARGKTLSIGQNDLSVFAGAKFLIIEISGQVTKSLYNRDLQANNARLAQFLAITGVDAIMQGFPETSVNLKLKWKILPLVRPHLSYTHTTFKLGDPPSNAYEVGGVLGLDMISVKAAYERYVQKTFPSQNYYTIGASFNF